MEGCRKDMEGLEKEIKGVGRRACTVVFGSGSEVNP